MAQPAAFSEFYASRGGGSHITVLISGGGIRAMDCGVHFLDHLKNLGILDKVDTVAGVSGGAWTCIAGGVTGGRSPFHTHQEQPKDHPWSRSAPNDLPYTLPEDHPYITMLSAKNCHDARDEVAKNCWWHRCFPVANIVESIHDFLDKELEELGFLGEALLSNYSHSTLMNWSVFLGAQILKETRHGNHRQLQQPPNSEVDLPLFFGTCVHELSNPIVTADKLEQRSQWYAFDGTGKNGGIRGLHPDPNSSTASTFNLDRLDTEDLYWKSYRNVIGQKAKWPLDAQRAMAICASAAGIGPYNTATKIFGFEGFRAEIRREKDDEEYALLVDAGGCCNIPFPMMLENFTGARTHTAIVLDCSGGDPGNAMELYTATTQGYYHPKCDPEELKKRFDDNVLGAHDTTCRIFVPRDTSKEPIIIYVLGEQKQSTLRMDRNAEEIRNVREMMARAARSVKGALSTLEREIREKGIENLDGIIVPLVELMGAQGSLTTMAKTMWPMWPMEFFDFARLRCKRRNTPNVSAGSVYAWHAYPTLLDAIAQVEKARFEEQVFESVEQMRADALCTAFSNQFPAFAITESHAFATRVKDNTFITDKIYVAFAWATTAIEIVTKGGDIAKLEAMGIWSDTTGDSKRIETAQLALYLFAGKLAASFRDPDDEAALQRAEDALNAWQKSTANEVRRIATDDLKLSFAADADVNVVFVAIVAATNVPGKIKAVGALMERLNLFAELVVTLQHKHEGEEEK